MLKTCTNPPPSVEQIPLNRPDHPGLKQAPPRSGPYLLEVDATIESKVSRNNQPYYEWRMHDPHADKLVISGKLYCAGNSARLFDWSFKTPHEFAEKRSGIFKIEIVTNDKGYFDFTKPPLYVSPSAEEMKQTRSRILFPPKPRPPGIVKVGAEVSFVSKNDPDRKHIGTVKAIEGNSVTVRVGDGDWTVPKESVTGLSKGFQMFNPDPSPLFIKPAVLMVEVPHTTSQIVADAIQSELNARYSTLVKGSALVNRHPDGGTGMPVVRGIFGVSDEEQPDAATLSQARAVVADVLKNAKPEWLGADLKPFRQFIAENPTFNIVTEKFAASVPRMTQ